MLKLKSLRQWSYKIPIVAKPISESNGCHILSSSGTCGDFYGISPVNSCPYCSTQNSSVGEREVPGIFGSNMRTYLWCCEEKKIEGILSVLV